MLAQDQEPGTYQDAYFVVILVSGSVAILSPLLLIGNAIQFKTHKHSEPYNDAVNSASVSLPLPKVVQVKAKNSCNENTSKSDVADVKVKHN